MIVFLLGVFAFAVIFWVLVAVGIVLWAVGKGVLLGLGDAWRHWTTRWKYKL